MPKISVVIPAYNAMKYLPETVESVLRQTFTDFEVLIINDGSSDHVVQWVSQVLDPRVRLISQENQGLPGARNTGIAHAQGEYVAFLDADDLWTADKLELQLAALQQHPEAGVAYSWTLYVDELVKPLRTHETIFFEGHVYAELLVNNFLANGSNPLIRRQAIEAVGKFDPAITPCADWDFYLRLAAHWPFVLVPKPQILYRQSSGSMASKVEEMQLSLLTLIEKTFQAAPLEFQSLKTHSLVYAYQYCADLYLHHSTNISMINQAGRNLWTSICLYPQLWRDKKTQSLVIWFIKKFVKYSFFIGGERKGGARAV